MKNRVITISREFGSGGRTIGKKVAEKLGIPCYDAEIIQEMAMETGFAPDYVNDQWIGLIQQYVYPEEWIAEMLRSHFYVCPVCGNVLHSMGAAAVSCHAGGFLPQYAARTAFGRSLLFILRRFSEFP